VHYISSDASQIASQWQTTRKALPLGHEEGEYHTYLVRLEQE
jgi:hypothetical protein